MKPQNILSPSFPGFEKDNRYDAANDLRCHSKMMRGSIVHKPLPPLGS